MSRIQDVYNYSSMNFSTFKDSKRLPESETNLPFSGAIKLGINVAKVKELWSSDDKCALMLFPYHVINFKGIVRESNFKEFAFLDLQKEIVKSTRRPVYIQEIVKQFFEEEIKEEYAALHWRYDPNDWFRHCDLEKDKDETHVCVIVSNARNNPEKYGMRLLEDLQMRNIEVLYMAAPINDHELISKIIAPIQVNRPFLFRLLCYEVEQIFNIILNWFVPS
jgi:hypothetical protein